MIRIEFSGTGDEVRNEMLKLLGLQDIARKAESALQEKAEEESSQSADSLPAATRSRRTRRKRGQATAQQTIWTEEDAARLMSEIKENARKILVELANRPEGYSRTELVKALGSSDQTVRGQLSSVGSALRRMGKKSSPISRTRVNNEFTYKLDPAVAAVAKQEQQQPA